MRKRKLKNLLKQITEDSFLDFLKAYQINNVIAEPDINSEPNFNKFIRVDSFDFINCSIPAFRFLIDHNPLDLISKLEKWIELEFYE